MTYRLFDQYAHRYDLHTPPYHYQDDHRWVLSHLRDSGPESRLLDIGCGTGVFLEKARAAGIDSRGIDSSAGMVRVARHRLGDDVVELRRMQDLQTTESVDMVTALSWTLNYCADEYELRDVLLRCHRALRPGGFFVAQVAHALNATGDLNEDIEPGPEGEADDITFFYRFSPTGRDRPVLRADYIYVCRSANELAFETHLLNVADVHRIAMIVKSIGFSEISVFGSWRQDPLGSSLSPFIVARRAR